MVRPARSRSVCSLSDHGPWTTAAWSLVVR
jgi:hypothetical protein